MAELLPSSPTLDPAVQAITRAGQRTREQRLVEGVLNRARIARYDSIAFFNFVMREEKTRARLVAAAHQRLFFEFVQAYPRVVVRAPVGSSKTFCTATLSMHLLGNDPTERGAIISATQGQAAKPLSMVGDYIENEDGSYPELKLVFPELRPSHRQKDPWTQTKLVVERPPGIRDPSLVAIGVDGTLPGARLSWIVVDDVLDEENTRTNAGRMQIRRWFDSTVLSRRDVEKSKIVVTNTPWHPEDLTYALEKAGWPTLTMSIEGEITLTNCDDFDSDEIRPVQGDKTRKHYRLAAHDAQAYGAPLTYWTAQGDRAVAENDNDGRRSAEDELTPYDVQEQIPLWPEKVTAAKIAELRHEFRFNMPAYNQSYRCECRDDESAAVKEEWIERCKHLAVLAGHHRFVQRYDGANVTVTGVDLAIGEEDKHDFTAYFTFELIPKLELGGRTYRNLRRILDIEYGRFKGRSIVDKLIAKSTAYNSITRVETNAAQDFIRQWTLDLDISVPVKAHTTGTNKTHRTMGVAGVFIEIENGAWLIPCDPDGVVPEPAQRWIEECLYYQPPPAHTGDVLMASWLARAQAREMGAYESDEQGGGAADVMAR